MLQQQVGTDDDLTMDDDDGGDGDDNDCVDLALDVADESQPLHLDHSRYILIMYLYLCPVLWQQVTYFKRFILQFFSAYCMKTLTLGSVIFTTIPATRRSSFGDRAVIIAATSVCVKLPQDIRSATSLPVFGHRLKTHLFNIAYNC